MQTLQLQHHKHYIYCNLRQIRFCLGKKKHLNPVFLQVAATGVWKKGRVETVDIVELNPSFTTSKYSMKLTTQLTVEYQGKNIFFSAPNAVWLYQRVWSDEVKAVWYHYHEKTLYFGSSRTPPSVTDTHPLISQSLHSPSFKMQMMLKSKMTQC